MEEFLKIKSLNEKYEVNEFGVVRSVKTKRILKPNVNQYGYVVLVINGYGYKCKNVSIHRLVAECFVGENDLGVNHIDGNKENNHYSNLEYVTHSENMKHAYRTGLKTPSDIKLTTHHCESHGGAKITNEIALEIIRIRKEYGYGGRKISKMLGVSRGIVNGILYQNNWKELK